MGSATREALLEAKAALSVLGAKADLATGEQLLAAGRVIGNSPQLLAALANPAAEQDDKVSIIGTVFASLGDSARTLLATIVASRWSAGEDLLAGIEELGVRVLARSASAGTASAGHTAPVDKELFAFGAAVSSDPELELAVGSKLGSPESKAALVEQLIGRKASPQTVAILSHLVQQPRGRRIAALLRQAATLVADEAGLAVATVTTAHSLGEAQLRRLAGVLSKSQGRELRVNQVIDPAIVGGIRVQIGDEVIDGSVATKLNQLRLQLAS